MEQSGKLASELLFDGPDQGQRIEKVCVSLGIIGKDSQNLCTSFISAPFPVPIWEPSEPWGSSFGIETHTVPLPQSQA